jgi:hypothetical protein
MTFQDHRRVPKSRVIGGFLYAATISLKRVPAAVMTFRISKYFHRSKSKLQI